jgi:hypothetical protein
MEGTCLHSSLSFQLLQVQSVMALQTSKISMIQLWRFAAVVSSTADDPWQNIQCKRSTQ